MTCILVIEDEIPICENVVDILEMEGFEAISAHNGAMGIELAFAYLPDLIICDIMMPGVDGYKVFMTLRDNPATALTPFIFLTAKADRFSMRYGMELGADDYLTKPFTIQDLVRAVTARLEKQRIMAQRHAQALEDLRGSIFTMLPHELRTPLVNILGYAELLVWDIDTLSPQRISEMAGNILAAGERLHHLIENFLIYAQIEIAIHDPERQSRLRAQSVSNPDQLTVEIARNKALTAKREADLQITVDEVMSIGVSPESLRKILEELLDNAFKFSHVGTPVEVYGELLNHSYQWTILDHGRGMTVEQIANVGAGMQFERRLYEQQGGGLGLTIAKQLVDLHAGKLDIESAPGIHTAVRVMLPVA